MRLSLNKDATLALERLYGRCKEMNPDIDPVLSTFLFQFLRALDQIISKDQWADLAPLLTSERVKRKRIVDRLLSLGDKLDESDIDKFERKISKKHTSTISDSTQHTAENS